MSYRQKWQQNDKVSLQVKSTLGPVEIDILNCRGQKVIENIPFAIKPVSISGVDYTVYECTIDFNTVGPGVGGSPLAPGEYYLYLSAGTISNAIYALSEPFEIKTKWPNTRLLEYKHNLNEFDTIWETGLQCQLRVECILTDLSPQRLRSSYENQIQSISTVLSVPYRKWKLKIGGEGGVPPWVADKINYILCMNEIKIDGLLMAPDEGAQLEPLFTEGYPAPAYTIDMREGHNLFSKRITAPGDINAAQMIVFDISSWTWFGSIGGDANSQPVRIQKEV